MTQGTLFDSRPDWLPVRSCDPEPSRAAAIDLLPEAAKRKREVLLAMRDLDRPATAREIQQRMYEQGNPREIDTVRSRLSQLKRDGLVRTAGLGDGIRRPVTRWELAR